MHTIPTLVSIIVWATERGPVSRRAHQFSKQAVDELLARHLENHRRGQEQKKPGRH